MAYLITQGGNTLYKMNLTTGVATALTLPTGITLDPLRKPKFAVLNQWVAMVNSPTRNLVIDPEGTVRVMVPRAPVSPPSVVAGASTGLTGIYQYKYSFVVLDSDGNLLQESPLSPPSAPVTLANTDASITDVQPSLDNVSARRVYRTLSGGTAYFHLLDVEGNVAEAFLDNAPDATVTLLPVLSDTLVSPPGTMQGMRLKNIVEWKSRFWAISDDPALIDQVFATETNKVYAWPNSVVAYPTGQDGKGVVGFAVRKNQLGLVKRTGLWQIAGSAGTTGIAITNVSVQQIAPQKVGSISPDSIITINDKVYWLGRDGVYEWGDSGVHSITDDSVAAWFDTDTYFNRARFQFAFSKYNENTNSYELHLAALGSSVEDRWVSFNLDTRKWYGPHQTAEFTSTDAAALVDENGLPITFVGSSAGVIYTANSANKRDGNVSAISMNCLGMVHSLDAPDIEHHWGQLSLLTKVENTHGGGDIILEVDAKVGRLDEDGFVENGPAIDTSTIEADLTKGRQLLRRLGDGPLCQLEFTQDVINQSATIYGYEISPVFENGRR